MKHFIKSLSVISLICLLFAGSAFASDMKGHDMKAMKAADRFGDLIHESSVDGYFLSYYLMDLRTQSSSSHDTGSMDMDKSKGHSGHEKAMDEPHHIMVYIMDEHHKIVGKGKVGFLIKDAKGAAQKKMGMFMSDGFGITADMKEKGVYSITVKAVLKDKTVMDRFDYNME